MMTNTLTHAERELLEWLGREAFSQYGECHGKSLDVLVARGLAQVHGPGEHQVFIAKGTSQMYRAVSLTDAGRYVLARSREPFGGHGDGDAARAARRDNAEETKDQLEDREGDYR